jgi:hypothetical protein
MKHDIFDFHHDMTRSDMVWRAVLLAAMIGVLLMDLFFWRP